MADYNELLKTVESKWYKPIGLISTLIVVILIEYALFKLCKFSNTWILSILVVSMIIVILNWFFQRIPKKVKKGKIGFVVSIACSDENENTRIKEDFIDTLNKLVKQKSNKNIFDFIVMPQHISEKIITTEDAENLRLKTRTHFLIYGRVRVRTADNKPTYFLDLDGIVAHKPIPNAIHKKFINEFSELFPRNLIIPKENNIFAFGFTCEWANLVAKYIIGYALYFSGNLNYAEELFNDVQALISPKSLDFPVFNKLNERLPYRLLEINIAKADIMYGKWSNNREEEYLEKFKIQVQKFTSEYVKYPSAIHYMGIYEFLVNRDIESAINITSKAKKFHEEIVWRYNLAFLYAYKGEIRKSKREYEKILSSNITLQAQTIIEIEEFILLILEKEPDKIQLFHTLGFYNWKFKEDIESAIKYFTRFLEEKEHFVDERRLVKSWIESLEPQLYG